MIHLDYDVIPTPLIDSLCSSGRKIPIERSPPVRLGKYEISCYEHRWPCMNEGPAGISRIQHYFLVLLILS